jgi:hypothetical protein
MRTLLLLIGLLGCSSSPTAGGCSQDCAAGSVCSAGHCVVLCNDNAQCNTRCCIDGGCAAAAQCGGGLPEVTSVDSTGSVDPDGTHAAHHLTDQLVLEGSNLEAATVQLSGEGRDEPLEVCDASPTGLIVNLPSDLQAGDYTLMVANQAGSCSAAATLLQG